MRLVSTAIAGATALLASSFLFPAASGAALVQKFDASLRPNSASARDKPRPLSLQLRFSASEQPITALAPLRKIEIQLGRGFRFEGRSRPRCLATAFAQSGPVACPLGSKIGGGQGSADVSPLAEPVHGPIALYNGATASGGPAVLVVLDPDIGPLLFLAAPVQNHSTGPIGVEASLQIPPLLTLPGVRNAAVTSFELQVERVLVAPRACTGTWQVSGIFTYASGQVVRSDARPRCKRTG